jgi:hypothetical protein
MRVSLARPVQPETEDNGTGEDNEDGGDGAVHGLKPLRPVAEDEEKADDTDLIEKKDPNQAQKQARRFFAPGCGKGQHRRRKEQNALRPLAAVKHGQPHFRRNQARPLGPHPFFRAYLVDDPGTGRNRGLVDDQPFQGGTPCPRPGKGEDGENSQEQRYKA